MSGRIQELRRELHDPVTLRAAVEVVCCALRVERWIHTALADMHIDHEWFCCRLDHEALAWWVREAVQDLHRDAPPPCVAPLGSPAMGLVQQRRQRQHEIPAASGDACRRHMKRLIARAAWETALYQERQRDGIARAKARGVYTGGKPRLNGFQRLALSEQRAAGVPIPTLMRTFQISRASIYRYLSAEDVA